MSGPTVKVNVLTVGETLEEKAESKPPTKKIEKTKKKRKRTWDHSRVKIKSHDNVDCMRVQDATIKPLNWTYLSTSERFRKVREEPYRKQKFYVEYISKLPKTLTIRQQQEVMLSDEWFSIDLRRALYEWIIEEGL